MRAFLNAAACLLVGSVLAACGRDHDLDCLKSNGPVVTQRRAIDRQLQAVFVYENVDLTIVPDTAVYAEVRAGEHVIDAITFTTTNHQLTIHNTSRCNWVRSYDTPREVRLHLPTLRRVEQHGYGLIGNEGQWTQDTLYLRTQSVGDISMNLRSHYLYVDSFDAGDLTLSGSAHELHATMGSNGFLFAKGLQAEYCYFFTYPTWVGDAHASATRLLGGSLSGRGTWYYTGTPAVIDVRGPSAGQLRRE